jgi:hypothetical protein
MLANLYRSIQVAKDYADITSGWVVLVTPSSEIALKECEAVFMGVVEPQDYLSGRTIKLPSGGKLSMANCVESVFVPPKTPFAISFLNWGLASRQCIEASAKWRASADDVIDVEVS